MDWYVLALIASTWSPLTDSKGLPQGYVMQPFLADQKRELLISESQGSRKTAPRSLYSVTRSITVKVIAGNSWGSGILVQQQGQRYSVLTNHHVLNPGTPYRIQTPDDRIYSAALLDSSQFQHRDHFLGNDLEILQFSSPEIYAVAALNPSGKLTVGEEVFAAGFPTEVDPSPAKGFAFTGFAFTTGQISLLQDQAFVGGYRIGYTNSIRQGMSGGPLMNREGEVVGINGLHAYPGWGNPHVFRDGSQPPIQLQTAIVRSSWAIPIATFVCLAPLTQMSLSVPINRQQICSE
jgi:S1-C subfamily serine protease